MTSIQVSVTSGIIYVSMTQNAWVKNILLHDSFFKLNINAKNDQHPRQIQWNEFGMLFLNIRGKLVCIFVYQILVDVL